VDDPAISVVVIVKDEPIIEETLRVLQPICEAERAECIVIDASQGRLGAIEKQHSWVRWIAFEGPLGRKITIPHQRNAGVRAASSPLIAFCDAGGLPDTGWLHEMKVALERRPDAAYCGPIESIDSELLDTTNDLERDAPVLIGITANMGVRRQAFDAINGFDEQFDYTSDTDFGWRLEDSGTPLLCADTARMAMQWGSTTRNLRRARYYGQGSVRLIRKHPNRARAYFHLYPDLLAYPLWVLGLIPALVLGLWLWWFPVFWLTLLSVAIVKNIRHGQLGVFLVMKLYRSLAVIGATLRSLLPVHQPVIFIPHNDENPYLDQLKAALQAAGVGVALHRNRNSVSAAASPLLLPLSLCWRRICGLKLVHIHWTYGFKVSWIPRSAPLLRKIPRHQFSLTILLSRAVGLKWVYSAHNLLPHRPVFDDDGEARKFLITHIDGLITLTEEGVNLLREMLNLPTLQATCIPEGPPTLPPGLGRSKSRERWGIGQDRWALIMFGHLDEYKRVDFVLESLLTLQVSHPLVLVLAGTVANEAYREQLDHLARAVRQEGIEVILENRFLSEEDIGSLLEAADGAIFAFSSIMNSTSLRMASSSGAAIVAADLPALASIPGIIRFDPWSKLELGGAVIEAMNLSEDQMNIRREELQSWLSSPSWDEVGRETRRVYEAVLSSR